MVATRKVQPASAKAGADLLSLGPQLSRRGMLAGIGAFGGLTFCAVTG